METVDFQGGGFTPVPLFVPADSPDRPNELTLVGTADKGKSVLRFFPRTPWQHACDGGANAGQACEPAPEDSQEIVDCPGATCAAAPPRHFACAGGTRAGQPCTRPHQCPGGACRPGTTCHVIMGDDTGKPCLTDAGCAANAQCGRGLFELRNRVDAQGIGTIDRTAGFGGRGVCATGADEGGLCGGPLSCSLGFVDCVQYRAEARTYE